jgi:3-oxoacyl-[acyl-carrier-protein] synthase-3
MIPCARYGTAIIGTGHHVPARVLTNENLTALVDTSDEWIITRTGVRERRIAQNDENSGTLALEASRRALASAGLEATDLDQIIVCTISPEVVLPTTACLLQDRLGVSHKHIPALDLGAACTGFVYGLQTAQALMQLGQIEHLLLVGVDCLSRLTDYTDRSTCILFGDGAGAMVLKRTDDPTRGILHTRIHADGGKAHLIHVPAQVGQTAFTPPAFPTRGCYINMDGHKVFKLAVSRMFDLVEKTLAECDLRPEQIDLLVPHQANRRIIDSLADRLNLREDQVYVNIDRFGNTSAASIPMAYDECRREGRVKPNDVVLMVGFGAGLTWGSAVLRA